MATDICKVVGGKVRRLRLKRGWTQQLLADHAELTREHISAIETGRSEPGLRVLERIAEALDTPLGELVSKD
jgi:transcriptional regulator with XRE-family HTH domain